MRRRHIVSMSAAVAAMLAGLLVSSPASAAPTWVDPGTVSGLGDHVTQLQSVPGSPTYAAYAPRYGVGDLVWVDDSTDDIMIAERAGNGWQPPRVLVSLSTPPLLRSVGPDEVVYLEGDQLKLRSLDAGGATQVLSTSVVAGTLSRDGSIAWAQRVPGGQQLASVQLGGSGYFVQVERATAPVSYSEVATSYGDGPTIAWISQEAGGTPRAWVRTRVVDEGTYQTALSAPGSTAEGLSVAGSGDTIWTERLGSGPARVRAAEHVSGDRWSISWVSNGTADAASPAFSRIYRPAFSWVFTWREQTAGGWAVRWSRRAGTTWTAPALLDSGSGALGATAYQSQTGEGDPVVNWCAPNSGGGCTVKGAYFTGTSFSAPAVLGQVSDTDRLSFAPHTSIVWSNGAGEIRQRHLDRSGPYIWGIVLPMSTWSGRATATWNGADMWSTVSSYRLQIEDRGPRTAWSVSNVSTTTRARTLSVAAGHTTCVRFGGVDGVGNVSVPALSTRRCTTAPIDDRSLRRSKGWTSYQDPASNRGTLTRSTTNGARLTFSVTKIRSAALVVRQVARGGKIEIRVDGRKVKTVSTAGSARRKVVIPILRGSTAATGVVEVRVISGGRPVLVDGLFVTSESFVDFEDVSS